MTQHSLTQHSLTRRHFLKAAGIGAVTCALGGPLVACGSSASPQTSSNAGRGTSAAAHEVVVTMTTSSEPEAGFNPLFAWGCGEHVHEPLIQSTLITTDKDMNFVGDLALSWDCAPDGLTWSFILRDDVRFTDGEPLTAHDVAFTINGINANPASQADLSMVEQAVAVSDTQVELHMKKPFNAMLYTLAVVGIVPEHAYDAQTYGDHPIGSGRYMLEQWDRGQQVILKANPDYYGEAPNMERVIVLFMGEDASLAAANAGQADVCYTAATIVDANRPRGYTVLNCASVDSRGISLPCTPPGETKVVEGDMALFAGNPATCDQSLRRAINMAVDRFALIDNVLNGYGTVAYSVSDGMPWYNPAMEVALNTDAAREVLRAGGWVLGEDGVYIKDGIRAAFDLYYPAADSDRQALAHEFANQMKEIGVEVTPVGGAWSYGPDGIYDHQFSDPVLWGWGANSPVEMYALHYSTSEQNYADYKSEAVDSHFDAALSAMTIEESYPEWRAAQWDGADGFAPQGAASWVWLCNLDHLYFKRDGLVVADQKLHPHGHGWSLVNNVDAWYWE